MTGGGELKTAALWSYAQNLGLMGISTGLTLVLAATLGPRAFGVMALALAFTGLIEMLQKQGLEPAIISRPRLTEREANTAFWLVIGTGLALTAVGLIVAPLWARLNGTPELSKVIRVLALGVPVTSMSVVQEAMLRRKLAFRELAIRTWVAAVAGGILGITGAALGWGVWALVAQQLTTGVVGAMVLWTVASWRPGRDVDLATARSLWSYSLRSVGGSVALFLGGRLDVLLSGPIFSPIVVGLYRMANRLTTLVVDVSARSTQAISLPALSPLRDDMPAFRRRLSSLQRATAALCLPCLGVAAGGAWSIEGLLGNEWDGTALAIVALSVGQAASCVALLIGPALQAIGRPGTTSLLTWCGVVLTATSLAIAGAVWRDDPLVALSSAVAISMVIAAAAYCFVAIQVFGLTLRTMARSWAPGLVGAVCGALASYAMSAVLSSTGPWPRAVGTAMCGLTFAGAGMGLAAPDYVRVIARHMRTRPGKTIEPS